MHECPGCGMACDCDGEDTWFDWPFNSHCTCQCEEFDSMDDEVEVER